MDEPMAGEEDFRGELARMLEWDAPREVHTRKGVRRLLTATPDGPFLERALQSRKRFKAAGFSLSGERDEVCWWTDPDEPLPDGLRIAKPDEMRLDGLLDWSEPRTVHTKRGARELRKAAPDDAFRALWSAPQTRRALRKAGISLGAYQGREEVAWWRTPHMDLEASERSRATAADAEGLLAPEGLAYLPFQAAGIRYCMARERVLLADEMGLGKTIQALGLINNADDVSRALVVAPASLALNWRLEARKWRADGAPACLVEPKAPIPDGPVTAIATYSMLTRLKGRLAAEEWDLIVFDEAHYLKNPRAQRTKAALALRSRRDLFMTGTPILNRPVELWPLLQRIDPRTWDSYPGFTSAYCAGHRTEHGWNAQGASNMEELQQRLRSTCMVRRLKADVLRELPAKRRQVIPLRADGDVLAPLESDIAEIGEGSLAILSEALDGGGGLGGVAFRKISRVMQAIGARKARLVGEEAARLLESVPKLVVFAHHHVAIDRIEAALRANGVDGIARLTGRDGREARQAAVERFQGDPDCRAFIGSIGAAGVGLTLTAASDVVFAELPWRPSDLSQAEDRCHRIGQDAAVNVRHYVLQGSLDERIVRLLVDKQEAIDRAMDAPIDWENAPAPEAVKVALAPERAPLPAPAAAQALGMARIGALLARCDGVSRLDGAGFSRATVGAGSALAAKDAWTLGDLRRAAWVCAVHKGQLADLGHPHDEFMAAVAEAAGPQARGAPGLL